MRSFLINRLLKMYSMIFYKREFIEEIHKIIKINFNLFENNEYAQNTILDNIHCFIFTNNKSNRLHQFLV